MVANSNKSSPSNLNFNSNEIIINLDNPYLWITPCIGDPYEIFQNVLRNQFIELLKYINISKTIVFIIPNLIVMNTKNGITAFQREIFAQLEPYSWKFSHKHKYHCSFKTPNCWEIKLS